MPTVSIRRRAFTLPRPGQGLEHRDHLHLADGLVGVRLASRSSRQGQAAHLELVLHLGPLTANLGSLFECSGALLGSECGRLRHGETIAPRPGAFIPIFPTQPMSGRQFAASECAGRAAESAGSGPLASSAPRAAGQHAAGRASGEPVGHVGRTGPLGARGREPELPLRAGTMGTQTGSRVAPMTAPTVPAGTSGGAVQRGDLGRAACPRPPCPPAVTACCRPRPSGLELRATTRTPRPLAAGQPDERRQGPETEVGVRRHGVGGQRARSHRARRRRRPPPSSRCRPAWRRRSRAARPPARRR